MGSGKVILGVLAGAAAGAILGVLLAPEKGSKTRRQIIDKSDDYVQELKSKFDDLCDSVSEKFASTKKDAENLVSTGKEKYNETINTVSDAKNALQNNFSHPS